MGAQPKLRAQNFLASRGGLCYNNRTMEITASTPQLKDKTRCNIEVDGRFYCGMKLETVVLNRLKAGMQVTAEQLSQMQLESEKTTALDKALYHITATMKTEREVRDYLKRKGYLDDVCDYVVEKMKEYGYLDDGAYAVSYVGQAGNRKGKRLLAAELKRKGIADEQIQSALDTLTGEEESAKAVLAKYLRGKTIDRKTLQKAFSNLIARGFDYDTARAALGSLAEEDE